jgi:hypothetical protein
MRRRQGAATTRLASIRRRSRHCSSNLFLEAHTPKEITLDLDATGDPLHGYQPLLSRLVRLPLLSAALRIARQAAVGGEAQALQHRRVRRRDGRRWCEPSVRSGCWPGVAILLRVGSGFARDELMAWCEANRVDCARRDFFRGSMSKYVSSRVTGPSDPSAACQKRPAV